MLGWGMTDSGIGVSAAPGQDGSAIDDQITCPDQPTPQGRQHAQDEECLGSRRSGSLTALALLGGTGNAWPPVVTKGQAARACAREQEVARTPGGRCAARLLVRQARAGDSGDAPIAPPGGRR